MASEGTKRLTIKFKPEGDKKLISALNKLAKAQSKLTKANLSGATAQKKYKHRVDANNKALKTQGALLQKTQGFIANYRNRMLLAAFAITFVNKALVSFVKRAAVQENSVRKLADVFGGKAAVELDKYSSQLQQTSVYGDELTNNVMAQIGAFGANAEQTKALTKTTMDLAAGLNLDLNTAGLLIAKTFGSSTNALIRYGVTVDATASKQEKMAAITAAVEAKWGGLAEKLSQTTEGQLAQASNAWGDFLEEVGQVIAPVVLNAAEALKTLAEHLDAGKIKQYVSMIGAAVFVTKAWNNQLLIQKGYWITRNFLVGTSTILTVAWSGATGFATTMQKGLTTSLIAGKKAVIALTAAMKRNPVGLIAALFAAGALAVANWYGVFEDKQDVIDEEGRALKAAAEEAKNLRDIQEKATLGLQKQLNILNARGALHAYSIEQARELTIEEINAFKALEQKNKALEAEKIVMTFAQSLIKQTIQSKKDLMLIRQDEISVLKQQMNIDLTKAKADEKAFKAVRDAAETKLGIAKKGHDQTKSGMEGNLKSLTKLRAHYNKLGIKDDEESRKKWSADDQKEYNARFGRIEELAGKHEKAKSKYETLNVAFALMAESGSENIEKMEGQLLVLETAETNIAAIIQGLTDDITTQGNELTRLQGIANETFNAMTGYANSFAGAFSSLYQGMGANVMGGFKDISTAFVTEQDKQMEAAHAVAAEKGEILEGAALKSAEDHATEQAAQAGAMEMGAQITAAVMENEAAKREAKISAIRDAANVEIDQLRLTRRYGKMNDKQKKEAEDKIKKKANEEMAEEFEKKKAAGVAGAIMDTAAAVMGSLAVTPPPAGIPLAAMVGVMGALQVATIMAQKPPKMALGGLVGGLSHGLGGTPINAERGEFVMQKKAVESIGIENMNKINAGGLGGAPVNVSFSGNINSDDFIESEAIPKIKEAIRRGADIGVG